MTVNLIFIPFRIFRIFICIISASFLADYEGNSCHTFFCFSSLLLLYFAGHVPPFGRRRHQLGRILSPALNLRPYILPRWLAWAGKYLAISYTSHSSIISRFILLPCCCQSWLPACHRQSKHYSKSNFIRTHSVSSSLFSTLLSHTHAGKFLTTLFIYCSPCPTCSLLCFCRACVCVRVCVVSICIYVNMLHTLLPLLLLLLLFGFCIYISHNLSAAITKGACCHCRQVGCQKPKPQPETKPKTASISLSHSFTQCVNGALQKKCYFPFYDSHFLTENNNFAMAKLYFMLWILWKRKQ